MRIIVSRIARVSLAHARVRPRTSTVPRRYQTGIASTDLLEHYRGLVASGRLKWDDEQVRVVMALRHLFDELKAYRPPLDLLARLTPPVPLQAKQSQWWKGKDKSEEIGEDVKALVKILSGDEEVANLKTPRGILITGPPGTGKSLLLLHFFNLLPTTHKRRWHYHAFTLWLYRRVFAEMQRRKAELSEEVTEGNKDQAARKGWRSVFAGGRWNDEGEEVRGWKGGEDTIPFCIARDMILEYHILYFDELQLVDASSAALIRDVLTWYWRLGGVIVTCSNRLPDDLYHHGVQKDRMAGFLDSLKARCDVVELDGGKDWRQSEGHADTRWFAPDDTRFEEKWKQQGEAYPVSLSVYGRPLRVPEAAGLACRFSFADLYEQALGPADYITLSSTFSHFFIDAVPPLLLKNKNEARRLINLVDAMYESRCQLDVRASTSLAKLFFPDAVPDSGDQPAEAEALTNERIMAAEALSETLHEPALPNVSVYNPMTRVQREKEASRGGAFGVLGIWTGEDERFAYKRAVSRLHEMTTSPNYLAEEWLPLDASSRAWETVPTSKRATFVSQSGQDQGDFAEEAAYSRPGNAAGPPIITPQHVWGVEDSWGPKAGKWGKGVNAFKK